MRFTPNLSVNEKFLIIHNSNSNSKIIRNIDTTKKIINIDTKKKVMLESKSCCCLCLICENKEGQLANDSKASTRVKEKEKEERLDKYVTLPNILT